MSVLFINSILACKLFQVSNKDVSDNKVITDNIVVIDNSTNTYTITIDNSTNTNIETEDKSVTAKLVLDIDEYDIIADEDKSPWSINKIINNYIRK